MEVGFIAIIIVVVLRIVAGLNIPVISKIIRWWWNLSFKIAAHIPFCGWMSHFIITKGDKNAEAAKEHYVNIGRKTDNIAVDMLEQSAARAKAEQEAYQTQLAQEEAERRALEEDLRGRAYRTLGTRDVRLNSDGSMAKVGNSDYISTEELKKKLQ